MPPRTEQAGKANPVVTYNGETLTEPETINSLRAITSDSRPLANADATAAQTQYGAPDARWDHSRASKSTTANARLASYVLPEGE